MFAHPRKGKFSVRAFITWLILCVFTVSCGKDFSIPRAFAQIPLEVKTGIQAFNPQDFPESLGRVESFHQGEDKDKPVIFFLQDAHAVKDAQRSIQNVIAYLEANQGVRLVTLEGSEGKIDPVFFQTFPDKFIKKKVLEAYLERGELSGAELAAVSETSISQYAGLEDWNLYQDNQKAYLEALAQQPELEKVFLSITLALGEQRHSAFSPELNRFYDLRESFYSEKSNLFELIQDFKARLSSGLLHEDLFHKDYPQLSLLIEADGRNLPAAVEADVRKMAESFRAKIARDFPQKETPEFSSAYQSFLTGQLDPGNFLRILIREGSKFGFKPRLTQGMQSLLLNTESFSMLKGTSVFSELESALDLVEKSLKPTEPQREILEACAALRRLKHLAALEMTPQELERYRQDPEKHLVLLGDSRAGMMPALEFYRLALERDRVFHRNLENLIRQQKPAAAVVVAGGFHTQGFEEELLKRGYSYAVISPRVDSLEGYETYAGLMEGNFSYKSYLETTYYDAFVRHAGIQLMQEVEEPEFKKDLKLWRDDVIRRLSADGRIDQVSDYTRYIDLLFKVYQQKFRGQSPGLTKEAVRRALQDEAGNFQKDTVKQWKDAFTSGLGEFTKALLPLEQKGALNVESVSSFFPSSGSRPDALSIPRAMTQSSVLSWQKPHALSFPKTSGVASEKVPFSPGNVMTSALQELAREGAPAEAVTESARRSVATLENIARQAESAMPGSETPVVRDVGAAKEGLRSALQDLPAPVPEMAREILKQGGERIAGNEEISKRMRSELRELESELQVGDSTLYPTDAMMAHLVNRVIGADILNIANPDILEMGIGSGVLTGALAEGAQRKKETRFMGIDINPEAVRDAKKNLEKYPQVEIRQGNFFSPLRKGELFDVIFWNPPWYSAERPGKRNDIARMDKDHALLRQFLLEAPRYLKPGGKVYLIFPEEFSAVIWEQLAQNKYEVSVADSYGWKKTKEGSRRVSIYELRPLAPSSRSELRHDYLEGPDFDKELNRRLVQLQWLWYGADEKGQPHENNLYRLIEDARAKAFPDIKAELDPEANRAYQAEVYKILERSYNHPEARRLLSEISQMPGVDPRIFFFHGSIYDAFNRSMTAVKEGGNKASRDYGDEMPSTPNFYRFDGYDFSDFHQVFVELVQNNQLHMKPNSTILALKHENEKDLQLIYYYGNYNTHDASRIEESMYGGSFTSGYGGQREHAFFNTIAPAVFQLGGTIQLEFDGKVQEFYPRNWAAWNWLHAWTPLWRAAWFYLSLWFFRSGIGKKDLGASDLMPRRGIKITLSLPKKNLKRQPLSVGAPVNVESSRFRVPGGISEVLVYSVYDEEKNAVHVYISTEEIQSGKRVAVSADLLLPGNPSETRQRHNQVIEFVRDHPFNYLDSLTELDPQVEFREGRRMDVRKTAPNAVFVTHLLTRFLPDIDIRHLRVADKEDDGAVLVLMTPFAVSKELEPRLLAFRDYLLQSFDSWEVQYLKPTEEVQAYGFVIRSSGRTAAPELPRSELREEEPPQILEMDVPREQYWAEIVRQLGLEKITTGGTAKIYKSSVYPQHLLKKKEIPDGEVFRIEAPWNTDNERAQISAELSNLDLAVAEKPIVIKDLKSEPGRTVTSNMSWQKKVIPVDNAWDPNPEKRPALAKAVLENLKGLWKAGYFDADFKMGNLGIYTRRDDTRGAGLIDFDFVYKLPDSSDPEVIYQWLKKRDLKESDRLHFSAGEHFVSNFFYYENSSDEEEKAKKRDVARLSFLRRIVFPEQDPETARAAFSLIYGKARAAYRALNLSPEEIENPPLEKVRQVKQAILTAMDEEPLVDTLLRQLALSISKTRGGDAATRPNEPRRSELRSDSNPLAVSLGPEETAVLEKRVKELSAFYKQHPMSQEAREQFFYPGILSVFLGLRPGFLSYSGKDPDPLELIAELEDQPDFPVDYFSVMDPGMILDSRGVAERLVREGQFLFEQGILKESDKALLDEVRNALQANDPQSIRRAVEPILSALIEELLRPGGYIPKRQTNQDAIFGFLLGYPLPSVQAIMRWRLSGYDEDLPPIQTVSPETKYPSIGITTDLTKESAVAVLSYQGRLEASLDFAYSRFAQDIPDFDGIEKSLQLPKRSELRAEEIDTPRPEEIPDEFGFQPREWLEKLSRIRLFWEGENAFKFGEMKALIEKYKDVKGMRSMVSRLASSYLNSNRASFNEVAGELFIVDRLVEQLAPFYDVQVLGLGLYAGFREIDGFLKVTPKPGVEIPGPVLEGGLYILEAKEDDGVQLQGLINNTIKSQVSAQIRNTQFLARAGLPFRGAIVGAGGERSQRTNLKEEEKPDDSPVPVYSFVTDAFSIENNKASVQVPAPSRQQLEAWNDQRLFIEAFFYKVLLPAFGLSPLVMGAEGERRNAALRELERREKIQRDIARRNIQRKKKEREALYHELERRAREIEGWGDAFETLADPEIKAEPLLLKTVLSWYFNRRSIPLEILRNDLHLASYAPKQSPETLTLPIREASSTDEAQDVHELQITSAASFSREHAWTWLKEQFQKSQQAEPKAAKVQKPQTPSSRPQPKPKVEPAVREAHGWVSSFVHHEDVNPPLTDQDAGYVENVLWVYFQGNADRGQTVPQSRRQLQGIFSQVGRNGAWEWVQAEAERLYGGPVDRSELRSPEEPAQETLQPGSGSMRNVLPWLPRLNAANALHDIAETGGVEKAADQVWKKEGEENIDAEGQKLGHALEEAVLGQLERGNEAGSGDFNIIFDEDVFAPEYLAGQLSGIKGPVNVYNLRDRLISRASLLAEGRRESSPGTSAHFKVSAAQRTAADFFLNPSRRTVLLQALAQHFGREVKLQEGKRLMIDLSLFEGTPFLTARGFVEQKLALGKVALAYLKSTETSPGLAEVFRLPGLERHFYTVDTPLLIKPDEASQTTHILVSGTLVEAKGEIRAAPGVFVSRQVYLGAGLNTPEFEGAVQLALSVESLRKQLKDEPGSLFPELTADVLQAIFGLLEDLMTTEAARQAVASAA